MLEDALKRVCVVVGIARFNFRRDNDRLFYYTEMIYTILCVALLLFFLCKT